MLYAWFHPYSDQRPCASLPKCAGANRLTILGPFRMVGRTLRSLLDAQGAAASTAGEGMEVANSERWLEFESGRELSQELGDVPRVPSGRVDVFQGTL
jgi:hypothetical protein